MTRTYKYMRRTYSNITRTYKNITRPCYNMTRTHKDMTRTHKNMTRTYTNMTRRMTDSNLKSSTKVLMRRSRMRKIIWTPSIDLYLVTDNCILRAIFSYEITQNFKFSALKFNKMQRKVNPRQPCSTS